MVKIETRRRKSGNKQGKKSAITGQNRRQRAEEVKKTGKKTKVTKPQKQFRDVVLHKTKRHYVKNFKEEKKWVNDFINNAEFIKFRSSSTLSNGIKMTKEVYISMADSMKINVFTFKPNIVLSLTNEAAQHKVWKYVPIKYQASDMAYLEFLRKVRDQAGYRRKLSIAKLKRTKLTEEQKRSKRTKRKAKKEKYDNSDKSISQHKKSSHSALKPLGEKYVMDTVAQEGIDQQFEFADGRWADEEGDMDYSIPFEFAHSGLMNLPDLMTDIEGIMKFDKQSIRKAKDFAIDAAATYANLPPQATKPIKDITDDLYDKAHFFGISTSIKDILLECMREIMKDLKNKVSDVVITQFKKITESFHKGLTHLLRAFINVGFYLAGQMSMEAVLANVGVSIYELFIHESFTNFLLKMTRRFAKKKEVEAEAHGVGDIFSHIWKVAVKLLIPKDIPDLRNLMLQVCFFNQSVRAIKNFSGFIQGVLKMIKSMFGRICAFFGGYDYIEAPKMIKKEIIEWQRAVAPFIDLSKRDEFLSKSEHYGTLVDLNSKRDHLIAWAQENNLDLKSFVTLQWYFQAWTKFYGDYVNAMRSAANKMVPTAVYFHGLPYLGKSTLMKLLRLAIMEKTGIETDIQKALYSVDLTSDYFEGFVPGITKFVQFDDIFQSKEQTQLYKTVAFLNHAIDDTPYNLNMAFQNKGCTFFDAEYLFATSNSLPSSNWLSAWTANPTAIARRFQLVVEVIEKPKDNDKVQLDGYKFNISYSPMRIEFAGDHKETNCKVFRNVGFKTLLKCVLDVHAMNASKSQSDGEIKNEMKAGSRIDVHALDSKVDLIEEKKNMKITYADIACSVLELKPNEKEKASKPCTRKQAKKFIDHVQESAFLDAFKLDDDEFEEVKLVQYGDNAQGKFAQAVIEDEVEDFEIFNKEEYKEWKQDFAQKFIKFVDSDTPEKYMSRITVITVKNNLSAADAMEFMFYGVTFREELLSQRKRNSVFFSAFKTVIPFLTGIGATIAGYYALKHFNEDMFGHYAKVTADHIKAQRSGVKKVNFPRGHSGPCETTKAGIEKRLDSNDAIVAVNRTFSHCLFINPTRLLVPAHMFVDVELEDFVAFRKGDKSVVFQLKELDIVTDLENDECVVVFDAAPFQGIKDIFKYFITEAQFERHVPKGVAWRHNARTLVSTKTEIKGFKEYIVGNKMMSLPDHIETNLRSRAGTCNSACYTETNQCTKICGLLKSGSANTATTSFAIRTQEYFLKPIWEGVFSADMDVGHSGVLDLEDCAVQSLRVVPQEMQVPSGGKSSITPALWKDHFDSQSAPAMLTPRYNPDGQLVDPVINALKKKLINAHVTSSTPGLDYVTNYLKEKIPVYIEPKILNTSETLNGGRYQPFLQPVELSTSAGYMYNLPKNNKKWVGKGKACLLKRSFESIVFKDEQSEDICRRAYTELMRGNVLQGEEGPVVVDFLKDEVLPLSKVFEIDEFGKWWIGNSRIVSTIPFHYLFAQRKLFGAFYSNILKWRTYGGPIDVGINPYTDWAVLSKMPIDYFKVETFVAGDFSKFDASIAPILFDKVLEIILHYYKDFPEHHIAMRTLFDALGKHCTHQIRDIRYVTCGNPSGQFLTTILNSLVVLLILLETVYNKFAHNMSVFDIDDLLDEYLSKIHTYGDDHVLPIVQDGFEINMFDVNDTSIRYGMTYTNIYKDRDLVPYIHREELIYLQRRFVKLGPRVVAPLSPNAILGMLCWNKDTLPHGEREIAILRSLAIEMTQYSESEYNDLMEKVKTVFRNVYVGHPLPYLPYHELVLDIHQYCTDGISKIKK